MLFSLFDQYKTIPLEKLFEHLTTKKQGLSNREATQRLKIFGLNESAERKRTHSFVLFFSHLKDPLMVILIAVAGVSFFVGETRNAVIVLFMVFLGITINFFQEYKSGKAVEALMEKMSIISSVLRDGTRKDITVKQIVPGDVIFLSAGNVVPADGRIIQSEDFFVNESSLTGESFPVEKTNECEKTTCDHVIYAGSSVVSGSAYFVAVRTGKNTEFGKIGQKISLKEELNAFEHGLRDFGYLILKSTLIIVAVVFFLNVVLHRNILESFIFSIAIAVGFTPELLPVITAINMAKGSIKMSKKGVIVKKLNAIPDFGSMDVLCTDKTGTLTQDKITVVKYVDAFGKDSNVVLRKAYINGYFETGLKSPLEMAVVAYRDIDVKNVKKIDEIPYDSFRKRLSVVVEENGQRLIISKGAPEEIFKITNKFSVGGNTGALDETMRKKITALYDDLSNQGFRVLAVSEKEVGNGRKIYPKEEEVEMSFVGFIAFYDPPKQSAGEAMAMMNAYGVEVKVVTGDSLLVSKKVCQELKFKIFGTMTGDELEKINDEALAYKVGHVNLFARVSPSQKNRIINAIKKSGKVVGYLGDGINDAPSLKSADVGISVNNAVDVAKDTADIILLNKDLRELLDGVIEGRKIFGNTMKYLMMIISSNFGNMFSVIGAVLYLPFLPMLPVQILLNNFLYDISQTTIPADNVDVDYIKKPKHWNLGFIKKFMLVFGPISSVFDLLTFYLLFGVFHLTGGAFQVGWFVESLLTQTLVIHIIRTRRVPFLQSRPSIYLVISSLAVVSFGLLVATTSMGNYFGFEKIGGSIMAVIGGIVLAYLLVVEMAKHVFYRKINY